MLLLLVALLAFAAHRLGLYWSHALAGWAVLSAALLAHRQGRDHAGAASIHHNAGPAFASSLTAISGAYGALDMPVLVIDAKAHVLFQNAASRRAFGVFPLNSHVSARLRSPAVLDAIRETIAASAAYGIEYSERFPSERVFTLHIAPIADTDGLFVVTFHDISELRRLDRMRSDFVANASHELRTPLASLRGFIETLQGPAREDRQAHDRFLAIMLDQAKRMSRLVDELLSLSRLELKSHSGLDQNVDLKPLLTHVRDALSPLAQDLGMEINLHFTQADAIVQGDRDELVQVFENLVENACKYGQDGKSVDVSLTRGDDGRIDVTVQDHGAGIAARHIPRLTERFYRVNVEGSGSKQGTGLGLAIVKHILTRHRAHLIISSQEGKGSQFTVRF